MALGGCGGGPAAGLELQQRADPLPSPIADRHCCSAPEDLNYTSVLFPGKGRGSGSDRNYENIKIGADYVNVDPKKKKADFWTCSSPVASKSIEYTEVKL
uniref:Uncharacterized protein n=1 Tax=Phasianus colchicus TaxID=9054 RepID=A0A669QX22_PHACC